MSPLHLDPVSLVQLPRPGSYVPNQSATLAFSLISSYHHQSNTSSTSLALINIAQNSPHTTILSNLAYKDAVWLDSHSILYLRPPQSSPHLPDLDPAKSSKDAQADLKNRLDALPDDSGKGIELWAIRVDDTKSGPYLVGRLPAPVANLKFQSATVPHEGTLAFTAEIYAPYDVDALRNVHKLEKSFEKAAEHSSGQTYDSLFVRHWDSWMDQHGKRPRLFVLGLVCKDERWAVADSHQPRSLFPQLDLPVGPFGSSDDFDLSPSSVVVTAKDPGVNPAWHTRQNIYFRPLFPRTEQDGRSLELTTGAQGTTSIPVFSPSAKASQKREDGKVAWLEMPTDGYEADQNQVVTYDLSTRTRSYWASSWDRSPSYVCWGKDDTELYVIAEEHGLVKAFRLSLSGPKDEQPTYLATSHSISQLAYLGPGPDGGPARRLLLTVSSLRFPNAAYLFTDHMSKAAEYVKLASLVDPKESLQDGEDFWFDGAEVRCGGFIVRPPGYKKDSAEKWPLMFLIHGGPQSAWEKSWGLRWNANTFAGAGYIVAMINPTGSTGYGQAFTDSINQNWGGTPFKDLVAGYEYLLKTYPEIDGSRTAALGASYGGYMVNWMMGHNHAPLNFKAFVCHDGIFNTIQTYYATEELWFPEHDHRGPPYQQREEYERWNPANFVAQWQTPCLVIHSAKDYRLPLSEGLSTFNALQRQGIPSRLLFFPDESHWVLQPANSVRWYQEVFRFLGKWCPPGSKAS